MFSLVFLISSCKKEDKKNLNSSGEIQNKIGEIASKHSIPKDILLTAAYTQSNFGADHKEVKKELSDSKRELYYGIQIDDLPKHINLDSDSNLAFYQITEYLASQMREKSKK